MDSTPFFIWLLGGASIGASLGFALGHSRRRAADWRLFAGLLNALERVARDNGATPEELAQAYYEAVDGHGDPAEYVEWFRQNWIDRDPDDLYGGEGWAE